MAVGYYTSNSLISAVKRKAMLPTNQSTFTNADFLAFANEELKMGICPTVLSLHEEFYVYPETIPLEANKSSYGIPYRAIGGKLRDVFFQDEQGNLFEMARISPDDKAMYQKSAVSTNYVFYYLEGNNIVITPNVGESATGNLLVTYYIRPSDLVTEDRVGIITDITTDTVDGTTTYTLDAVPTGMSTLTKLDLLQAKPGHKIREIDLLPSSINTTNKTITFETSEVDDETEAGDMISFAGECIIPQCPTDLHSVLAQRVAARCLEALGDTQGLTNANTKLQELEIKSMGMIDNRVDGSPQKVVNNRGLLRSSKIRRNRWY
jgi:hypothetical protein